MSSSLNNTVPFDEIKFPAIRLNKVDFPTHLVQLFL